MTRATYRDVSRLRDRRLSTQRRDISLTTLVTLASGQDLRVRVRNIGVTGLMFESAATHDVGQALTIVLPGDLSRPMRIMWNSGLYYGCQFDRPIPRRIVDSPLLMNAAEDSSGERNIAAPQAGAGPKVKSADSVEGMGYRIARLRKLRGWTQSDLAKALGVSKTTVCNWEREKCAPGQEVSALLWLNLGQEGNASVSGESAPGEQAARETGNAPAQTGPDVAAVIHRCKIEVAQAIGIGVEQVQITLVV